MSLRERIKVWGMVSRLPFLSVGIVPFVLGTVMASRYAGRMDSAVLFLGLGALILILLATHYNGEVHDFEEDRLSGAMERNFFSGGSQMIVEGKVKSRQVDLVAKGAMLLALALGVVIQFGYHTGIWTLPLGLSGILAGYWYSTPPLRWVNRGFGELLIGYSYGWLTVAAGYYLQTAAFIPQLHWIGLTIGPTIFNVILINEFPDYPADFAAGKLNLVVRLGKAKASRLYGVAGLASSVMFFCSLSQGIPAICGIIYLPVLVLNLMLAAMMLAGRYHQRPTLERMCLATILVNLGTGLAYLTGIGATSVRV